MSISLSVRLLDQRAVHKAGGLCAVATPHLQKGILMFTAKNLLSTLASVGLLLSANATMALGDDPTLSTDAAAARHTTYRFDTWDQLVHKWSMLGTAGLQMSDIEVLGVDGELHYAGTWEPFGGGDIGALHRLDSWDAFVEMWKALADEGYRLIDIERVEQGGSPWYYGLWRAGDENHALHYFHTWDGLVDKWRELGRQRLQLIDVDVSRINGLLTYIGVWRGHATSSALYQYSSWDDFVDQWNTLGDDGYLLTDMDIRREDDGTYRYVGLWHGGPDKRALYRYDDWSDFREMWAQLASEGFSLLDVEVAAHEDPERKWYYGTWGPAPDTPREGPKLDLMGRWLEANLGSNTVTGMAYALTHHGQLAVAGSTGRAQRWPDPDVEMSSKDVRSTIASATKALTAPLVYRLLEVNGLSVNTTVGQFLPDSWAKGDGFTDDGAAVTFHHLLTHTSGLNQVFLELEAQGLHEPWGNDWDGLEFIVKTGTVPDPAPDPDLDYKNANYALLRVLIPELWRLAGGHNEEVTKDNVGDLYLDYLRHLIAHPAQIDTITCWPQEAYDEALAYDFADPAQAGNSWSTVIDGCGGHAGLHFSAQELATYAAAFRYDRNIMTSDALDVMRDDLAGWIGSPAVTGGTGYQHDGRFSSNGRVTATCVMELPHGVNAAVIVNSDPPLWICSYLEMAFDGAF